LPRAESIALRQQSDVDLLLLVRAGAASEKVKAALREALAKKGELAETRAAVQKEEAALQVIEKDQSRMRANMERVPPTSEAYKRYLKKFDDQETEIEKRQDRVAKVRAEGDQQKKTYEDFLVALDVD